MINLYKAVLFDLDGTLIDTNELIIECFKHVFKEKLNIDVKDEEIVKCFGEPLRTTIERYSTENVDMLIAAYREYNETIHDTMALPIEGVTETIAGLKAMGIKVGVVTSKRRAMAERGLGLFNMIGLMDVIVTPEDTNRHKPDAEPALKACEILGIEPGEALFVGDSHFDIMCGHNAGMKSCFVGYSSIPLSYVAPQSPEYVVTKFEDILSIARDEGSFTFDSSAV